jgi:hypothetical protein
MTEQIMCPCGQPARPRKPSNRGKAPAKCAECYAAGVREVNRLAAQRFRASLTEAERKLLRDIYSAAQRERRARQRMSA